MPPTWPPFSTIDSDPKRRRAKPIPACTCRSPSDHRETALTCRPCGRWPPASTNGSANWGSGPPRILPNGRPDSGPVPTDTVGRAEWTDRAAIVASYREAFSIEGSDPIGPAPPPARPEARRWWTAAQAALTGNQLPAGWASDEDLAQRVAAGDRAEMDRPALVDLAGAAQSERDLQAELVYATEDQWRARTDPTITADDLAAARQRVHTTQEVLQEAKEHLRASEAGYHAYQQWETRTGTTRADAQAARRELVRRNPPTNAEPSLAQQPTSWVAYQSVQADRYLATKGRALDSAREAVRRLTHRIHRHTQAGRNQPSRPTARPAATQPSRRGPTGTRSPSRNRRRRQVQRRTRRPPRRPTSQNRRLTPPRRLESIAGHRGSAAPATGARPPATPAATHALNHLPASPWSPTRPAARRPGLSAPRSDTAQGRAVENESKSQGCRR